MDEKKIQLIFEALNKTKGAFTELENSLKGVSGGQQKLNAENKGLIESMKQNWLALSAAVAAVGAVIYKAFDYMNIAAKDQQAEASFRSVAAAAGESADEILAAMDRAANGTMDDSDIMQKAVKGMMQGLSGSQMVQIMEVARVAARTTGEDIKTVYENITDALANKMPRGLIKYGLVTKEQMKLLEAAMAAGVREVDLFKLAMANGADQMDKLGPIVENNSESLQKLAAWWANVKKTIGEALWGLISGIKSLATGTVDVIMGLMTGAITGIMGLFMLVEKGLNKLGLVKDETLAKTEKDFEKLKGMSKGFFSSAFGGDEKAPETKPKRKSGKGNSAASDLEAQMLAVQELKAREAELAQQIANVDIAERTRDVSHVEAAQRRLDLTRELLAVQEQNLSNIDKINNPQAWVNQQKAIDDTKKKMTEFNLAVRELSVTFIQGFEEGLKRYLDQAKTVFQLGAQLAQETAQAMQSAFSDFFFDAMQGKLKSLGDYITGFLTAVQRALANMMAQQAAQSIANFFSGAFSGGGTPAAGGGGEMGMDSWHRGGFVPRFHVGGLSSDEVPAILQRGEYVVSRKGVAALDAINRGEAGGGDMVINVINQTSQPVKATQGPATFDGKRYIRSVILEDLESNGAIRNAIKGLNR